MDESDGDAFEHSKYRHLTPAEKLVSDTLSKAAERAGWDRRRCSLKYDSQTFRCHEIRLDRFTVRIAHNSDAEAWLTGRLL